MSSATPINWRSLLTSTPAAIAMGNFDGVHAGHRRIFQGLREEAGRRNFKPLVLTFDPHPRHFLSPEKKAPLLTPYLEKESLIRDCGVEVITLSFDADTAGLSAEDFISEVLLQRLCGEVFFFGPGHRFGKGALGNVDLLRSRFIQLGKTESDPVREIAPVIDETGEIISSSSIRRHLEAGHTESANRMLGRNYCLRGEVMHGEERGRQLGFPTANLKLMDDRKALPAFGVYGGRVFLHDRFVSAIGNIGLRPTFDGQKKPSVEVHLLDVKEDLYGLELGFEILHYIRPEKAFDSLESLKRQISSDVAAWKAF